VKKLSKATQRKQALIFAYNRIQYNLGQLNDLQRRIGQMSEDLERAMREVDKALRDGE